MNSKFKFNSKVRKIFISISIFFSICTLFFLSCICVLNCKKTGKTFTKLDKLDILDKKTPATDYINVAALESWTVSIPAIGIKDAVIEEGTTQNVLNRYVGHFSNTSKTSGNIGLAAHNRGYDVNYFQNLKNIELGDEIVYKYEGEEKKYLVISKQEIDSYDWSFLEATQDDRITLITCIDNQPNLRLCVQGIGISKSRGEF